jgi:hypothetical protein
VAAEIGQQRLGQLEARGPQARARQVGRLERRPRAAGQVEDVAGASAAKRVGARAQLDDPAIVAGAGERRREAQLECRAVGAPRRERGGQRRRGVDDDEVPGAQEVGQVAGPRVHEAPVAAGDEHAHVVAREPTRLGGRVGLETLGELECCLRAQVPTFTSASR